MSPAKLNTETLDPQVNEYKTTLWVMECVAVLVQELLETYKDDETVIQSFLTEMSSDEMSELKLEIDKFQAHMSEVETGLALDRQELEV